jgi:uncharacterized repeat protein (TIGR01451 family)
MSTSLAGRTAADRPPPGGRRGRGFGALVAVLLLASAGYVALARSATIPAAGGGGSLPAGTPLMMVQNLAGGAGSGEVAVLPLADPTGPRRLTGLRCDRVHYAAGHGLCLAVGSGFPPVEYAMEFDDDFRVTHQIPLDGLPSRTRVSADGRYGAATVFVTGHSYLDSGFSTSTTLIDMSGGVAVANLEDFTILRDGNPLAAADVNFWGVTFAADSNRFYATMATGGHTYLVDGDIARRTVVVGRDNVECPSLSPDGTRIGFKKRLDDGRGSPVWRFHVLDLATGQETPLAELRNVDDQLEWLDDNTVVYGSPESGHAVFAVPADGSGQPRQLTGDALSPTVIRSSLPPDSLTRLADGPAVSVPTTELSVTATAPPSTAAGGTVVQTISVTNRGPVDATRLVVDDVVSGPGRVTAATAATPPGADGFGCTVLAEENRARCDVSRLPAGATWQVSITVSPTGAGQVAGRVIAGSAELTSTGAEVATVSTTVTGPP